MKRAQSAMEFLMTYGWAILVVLVAIAALAHFGILNPSRTLPESCILIPGLACTDFKVDSSTSSIYLTIQNGMGKDLNLFTITIDGIPGNPCVGDSSNIINSLNDGAEKTLIINCLISPPKNSMFKEDLILDYTINSLPHTKKGKLITKVE